MNLLKTVLDDMDVEPLEEDMNEYTLNDLVQALYEDIIEEKSWVKTSNYKREFKAVCWRLWCRNHVSTILWNIYVHLNVNHMRESLLKERIKNCGIN